ncbi:hypothetical protein GCM10027184_69820 [Saccharothrix stipae]
MRTLDQTGLAQKGGAVVSDLKVSAAPGARAPKLAAGECDLYLACDPLVGADPTNLAVADPTRTTAVVSSTEVPTGRMVVDTSVAFPSPGQVRSALEAATARTVVLDARAVAEQLFGDGQFANILQFGVAYQIGALPLPAAAVERAIELNGVAVERNVQAFRHGRRLVARPDADPTVATPAAVTPHHLQALVHAEPGSELARLLDIRVPDLVAYQDERYARDYVEFVERVRVLEGGPTAVTEEVARNLYKLMAYKDEYEVARLSLDAEVAAGVKAEFGDAAKVAFRLHPPVLKALGLKRKFALGPWFRPVLRALPWSSGPDQSTEYLDDTRVGFLVRAGHFGHRVERACGQFGHREHVASISETPRRAFGQSRVVDLIRQHPGQYPLQAGQPRKGTCPGVGTSIIHPRLGPPLTIRGEQNSPAALDEQASPAHTLGVGQDPSRAGHHHVVDVARSQVDGVAGSRACDPDAFQVVEHVHCLRHGCQPAVERSRDPPFEPRSRSCGGSVLVRAGRVKGTAGGPVVHHCHDRSFCQRIQVPYCLQVRLGPAFTGLSHYCCDNWGSGRPRV